jgi:hypothetical protein
LMELCEIIIILCSERNHTVVKSCCKNKKWWKKHKKTHENVWKTMILMQNVTFDMYKHHQ